MNILAFDLDGTLELCGGLITTKHLKQCVEQGWSVFILTARNGDNIGSIKDYMKLYDVPITEFVCLDGISESHIDWKDPLLQYLNKKYSEGKRVHVADMWEDKQSSIRCNWKHLYPYEFLDKFIKGS